MPLDNSALPILTFNDVPPSNDDHINLQVSFDTSHITKVSDGFQSILYKPVVVNGDLKKVVGSIRKVGRVEEGVGAIASFDTTQLEQLFISNATLRKACKTPLTLSYRVSEHFRTVAVDRFTSCSLTVNRETASGDSDLAKRPRSQAVGFAHGVPVSTGSSVGMRGGRAISTAPILAPNTHNRSGNPNPQRNDVVDLDLL